MRKKLFVTIIIILLSLITWILFLLYQTYERKVNFENELKCQEYANDFEDDLMKKTINLFKYKYGEDLSDEKIIKYEMSPYGIFYSTKHNVCMSYFNYDKIRLINPYMVASRDDAGYYARYCPDDDTCYYLYNKSFDDFSDGIEVHFNEDYREPLYYDINIDDDVWEGKGGYGKINWHIAIKDFRYTVSRLGIYETKSLDGFVAHHHTLFAFWDKSRQDFEEYRLYHDWIDNTLIIISPVVGVFIIYLVSHGIYLLFCKIGIVKNKKFKKKNIN